MREMIFRPLPDRFRRHGRLFRTVSDDDHRCDRLAVRSVRKAEHRTLRNARMLQRQRRDYKFRFLKRF